MNKSNKIVIILFSALAVVLLAFFIYNNTGSSKYSWYESYKSDSDQPYGTSYIKKLLSSYRQQGKLIDNEKTALKELLDSVNLKNPTDYIFIGQSLYLETEDKEALFNFIYTGHDAFVSSLEIPDDLLTRIYGTECNDALKYDNVDLYATTFNFYHDTLRTEKGYTYTFRRGAENQHYHWNYINPEVICDSTRFLVPLGYLLPDHVNFIRIRYGEGFLYLHTNPIAFTNFFLTNEEKAEYAAGVFSHLRGKDFIWDERSKVPFKNSNNEYDSPLYFILQQPSLKYAWWLMLITVSFYVIFAARRTQRIIPVLEVKSNTSLEFVRLISSLHFQNGNNVDMARKKMRYFQYFIRNKYGIHTQSFTDEQIKKLSEKSKVNLDDVQSIINQYNSIEADSFYNIEANRLATFYYSIEHFYKHCK